jgi:hypothetical protein
VGTGGCKCTLVGFQSFGAGFATDVEDCGNRIRTYPPGCGGDVFPIGTEGERLEIDSDCSRTGRDERPDFETEFQRELRKECEALWLGEFHGCLLLIEILSSRGSKLDKYSINLD